MRKTWDKALSGLYVTAAEHALKHLTGKQRDSVMARLQREAHDPKPPLPALTSACSLLVRSGKLERRMRAYFMATKCVGADLRRYGTNRAMHDYLTRFRRGL